MSITLEKVPVEKSGNQLKRSIIAASLILSAATATTAAQAKTHFLGKPTGSPRSNAEIIAATRGEFAADYRRTSTAGRFKLSYLALTDYRTHSEKWGTGIMGALSDDGQQDLIVRYGSGCLAGTAYDIRGQQSPAAGIETVHGGSTVIVRSASPQLPQLEFTDNGSALSPANQQTENELAGYGCSLDKMVPAEVYNVATCGFVTHGSFLHESSRAETCYSKR